MALFGRENETLPNQPQMPTSAPKPATSSSAASTTLVAAGAKLVGEITGDTDVTVEGTVEGRVQPKRDVTVGERGLVKGEVEARRVRIAGKVKGNVRGLESVEIMPSGSLEGDVASPKMMIGEGAFFKGRVEMTGNSSQSVIPQTESGEARASADAPK